MGFADDADNPSAERARIGREVAARLAGQIRAERVPSPVVELYVVQGYLSPASCGEMVRLIDGDLRPSEVSSLGDAEAGYRTSQSCNLSPDEPVVRRFEEGLASMLGIPPTHAEALQGQRYAPGQQFRQHVDYFRADAEYWPEERDAGGQRTWTAMLYLNGVEAGGQTLFVPAGISVRPILGTLLVWNNLLPDGSPNPGTVHEGSMVRAGAKYVVTKWYRERQRLPG